MIERVKWFIPLVDYTKVIHQMTHRMYQHDTITHCWSVSSTQPSSDLNEDTKPFNPSSCIMDEVSRVAWEAVVWEILQTPGGTCWEIKEIPRREWILNKIEMTHEMDRDSPVERWLCRTNMAVTAADTVQSTKSCDKVKPPTWHHYKETYREEDLWPGTRAKGDNFAHLSHLDD